MKNKEKKYKIGTLSVNIHTPDLNCGAILHSWAFIEYLKKAWGGVIDSAEVIDYTTPYLEGYKKEWDIEKLDKGNKLLTYLRLYRKKYFHHRRVKKLDNFIKKNMTVSKEKYTQQSLNDAKLDYDIVVCESDVIWSPGLCKGVLDKTFFLSLDSMKGLKRIAYAPSMADCRFNEEQLSDLKKYIKSVDYLSGRESYMEKFIKDNDVINKPFTHVLDPVMLLEPEDFDKITGPRITDKKYIFLYLPVNNNKKLRQQAKEFAERNNYYIVEYSAEYNYKKNDKKYVIPDGGVEEFLSAIKYADVIFTNSFHAVCFSILFKKQFYAFSRKRYGKVKDFCEVMGLENHFFMDDELKEQPNIDYDKVYKRLNKLRKQSSDYIDNALNN